MNQYKVIWLFEPSQQRRAKLTRVIKPQSVNLLLLLPLLPPPLLLLLLLLLRLLLLLIIIIMKHLLSANL